MYEQGSRSCKENVRRSLWLFDPTTVQKKPDRRRRKMRGCSIPIIPSGRSSRAFHQIRVSFVRSGRPGSKAEGPLMRSHHRSQITWQQQSSRSKHHRRHHRRHHHRRHDHRRHRHHEVIRGPEGPIITASVKRSRCYAAY